ncbi:MAG: CHAT domain-containing protein [Acidobacteriota bacterium]
MNLETRGPGRPACALVLPIAACLIFNDPGGAGSASFRDCEALVSAQPDDLASYECFYWTALRTRALATARRYLEALLARDSANHRARLALARISAANGDQDAESLYRAAAEGLAAQGDASSEVVARTELCTFLKRRGRFEEARTELEEAKSTAERSGDPMSIARASIEEGFLAYAMSDYGLAWTSFKRAEPRVFPEGPSDLQSAVLQGIGAVSWATGRYREAFECYGREADLRRAAGDPVTETRARYNMATIAWDLVAEGEMDAGEARRITRTALEAAVRAGNVDAEASARALLAADPTLDPKTAVEECEKALAGHRRGGRIDLIVWDLNGLASALLRAAPEAPGRAYRAVDQAIELARSRGALALLADSRITRAAMRERGATPSEVITEHLSAFEAIEAVRDLQRDDLVRAGCFSGYTPAYYQLASYLLTEAGGHDVDTAMKIVERMRARVLLDRLDASHATAALLQSTPLTKRRSRLLDEIAQVQRSLLEEELSPETRAAALKELDRLEVEERALRNEIARADPRFREMHRPELAGVSDIQQSLASDEALLSYQIPGRATGADGGEGGSWLVSITREQVRAYRLADPEEMLSGVELFLGMIDRRDGAGEAASSRLFDDLLAPALRDLPSTKTRLILVPDGVLYRLPFDALRCDGPRREFVVDRYVLSLVPSATVWLRLRNAPDAPSSLPAIILADPALRRSRSGPAAAESAERLWVLDNSGLLDALPQARAEGRDVRRWLGRSCLLLEGPAATESAIKQVDLDRFRILHFAAHTVLDEQTAERSAVLLAPGAPSEDGLLQIREIVGMRMTGKVVVLASCRSASGAILTGEGVVGIARAFLQAGARVVVGSLWPLRDADARLFFEAFYRELRDGAGVASAAAAARRGFADRCAPASEWAGVVVIGDGRLTPFPHGCPRDLMTWPPDPLLTLGLLIAALAASLAPWERRRADTT